MGSTTVYEEGGILVVSIPSLAVERSQGTTVRARVLRAEEGAWSVVAESDGVVLYYPITAPGNYRAEIRMTPRHLGPYLEWLDALAENEMPWIYGNAFRFPVR